VRRSILFCGCLAVLAAATIFAVTATAATKPLLVTAKVPLNQTVEDLLKNRFIQKATCRRTCDLATRVVIRPSVARRLGFKGVAGEDWVQIGTASRRLKASRPTTVTIHLTAEARRLLRRATKGLQVIGFVEAAAVGNAHIRGLAAWNVTCGLR
jgi:hypothetical protein